MGLDILASNQVHAGVWVAPRHAFNGVTLNALRDCGMMIISDGFGFRCVRDAMGFTWIPQQLWDHRDAAFGVRTICHHPNTMGEQELANLNNHMARFRASSRRDMLRSVIEEARPMNSADHIARAVSAARVRVKTAVKNLLRP